MKDILAGEGFRVTTRTHLDKDLDAIAALHPNLIIMDYMWNHSDDDWTLLNLLLLHRRTKSIPIVLCTGAISEVTALQDHLDSMGVSVVLMPFDIEHLIGVVNDKLGISEGTQDLDTTSPQ